MFETLESRELMSATLPTVDAGDTMTPSDAGTPDVTVDANARKSGGGGSSGHFYLVFTFKLVAVKTIS